MAVVFVLGALLVGALAVAWRIAAEGFRHLDLDPTVLVKAPEEKLARVLVASSSFAYEPLREAVGASNARARELWLSEADGTLHHLLRVPVGELRACARIATSASFCAAAWCVRLGIAGDTGARSFDLDGPLGEGLACIGLGFAATGALSAIHRATIRALADDRAAYARLLGRLDAEKSPIGAPNLAPNGSLDVDSTA
jgi:hypothetical protein